MINIDPESIKAYLYIKDKINNLENIIGFHCQNGKRLIIKYEHINNYVAINKNLQVVPMISLREVNTPFDLILSYFQEEESIDIKNIFVFSDIKEAIEWLVE